MLLEVLPSVGLTHGRLLTGPVNKRPRGPDRVTSSSPDASSPPESSTLMPVSRRSKAKAKATVKRNKFAEPLLDETSDSDDSDQPMAGLYARPLVCWVAPAIRKDLELQNVLTCCNQRLLLYQ